jgi:mannose-6-phosphate isomerase-like protein (cupin superfamily)
MSTHHIAFETMDWESPVEGQRFKSFRQDGRQIRIMEFTPAFEEEGWCTKGHIGYVLEGVLELEFDTETLIFREGDGLFVPAGVPDRHKARALTARARLVLVEEA